VRQNSIGDAIGAQPQGSVSHTSSRGC
jgi:hypothetical protein